MRRVFITGFVFILTGCLGPLVVHETARTVGYQHAEFAAGYGQAGAAFKFTTGLTERFDIGLQWESLSLGVRAKYALVPNPSHGWSAALAAGLGLSLFSSTHAYGDLMASYLFGTMEPYGVFRVVHVSVSETDFKSSDGTRNLLTIPAFSYNYGEFVLGTRIWFNPRWLLSIEAASLVALTSGLRFVDPLLLNAAFGYRF